MHEITTSTEIETMKKKIESMELEIIITELKILQQAWPIREKSQWTKDRTFKLPKHWEKRMKKLGSLKDL